MRKMGAPSAPPVLAATGMRRVSAAVRPKERANTCTIHIKGPSHWNRIIPEKWYEEIVIEWPKTFQKITVFGGLILFLIKLVKL